MGKITWNEFVEKYPNAGHFVSTGTRPPFAKPVGISPKNQKQFPTIVGIVKEAVGQYFTGDWATTTQKTAVTHNTNGKSKNITVTSHMFVFEKQSDALLAAKVLRAGPGARDNPIPPGFASFERGVETDARDYAELVRKLGY